ncbi:MAG: hypothetical protein ABI137_09555 [Antricoccus sp.]
MIRIDRRRLLAAATGFALAPLLAACRAEATSRNGPCQLVTSSTPPNQVLMIIRHAAKPAGSMRGVTADGLQDPESLAVPGWSRAGALVELFASRGSDNTAAPLRPGLLRPAAVVTSNPGSDGSKRPVQTVTPLAAELAVAVNLDHAKGQEAELVEGLNALAGPVLISWQHESIPAIVSHLGSVIPTPPPTWPDSRFDMVYVFIRSGDHWVFTQVPQLLMAGDHPEPIA